MIAPLLDDVRRKIREGRYEEALKEAKSLSIDLLKTGRRAEASLALSVAAHALCLLNGPAKSKSFAREAYDLAIRAKDMQAAGYARSVEALARLRSGDAGAAETLMDRALEALLKDPDQESTAFARLVAAEVALAQEDYAEARAFAEDAFGTGAAALAPSIQARAYMLKGVCEARAGDVDAAMELFHSAEKALERQMDAETAWLVQAAMAGVCGKTGREADAAECRRKAKETLETIAAGMGVETRTRFLKSPAAAGVMDGAGGVDSGLWRSRPQIGGEAPVERDETAFHTLRPVLDVIKKINSELNLRKLITTILDTMIEFCNAQRGTIVVFEGEQFKVELSRDLSKTELKKDEMGVSRTILQLVRDNGKRVVAEDAQHDPDLKLVDSVHNQNLLSILCVPLWVKTRLVGAVYLDNPYVAGAFRAREIEIAEILTDHAAVAIDNALLHIKSIHDGLTNLYNHGHFEKRLETEMARSRRHGRPCGLLMMDVDDFKHINDRYGHHAGNEVLKGVSRLIASTVRGADLVARIQEREAAPIVARYGGDEFEIILPDTPRAGVQRAGDRILEALKVEKFLCGDQSLTLSLSIGGAVCPDDAADARELLLKADEALYAAKREGKNRCSMAPPKGNK